MARWAGYPIHYFYTLRKAYSPRIGASNLRTSSQSNLSDDTADLGPPFGSQSRYVGPTISAVVLVFAHVICTRCQEINIDLGAQQCNPGTRLDTSFE